MSQAEILDPIKQKHRAMWALGDYDVVATDVVAELGPTIVDAAGITPGARVLDVAAGSGNASLPAAAAGGQVVASDLTPELLEERYQASIDPELVANPPLGRGELPILEELWRDARLSKLPHDTLVLWGREDRVNPLATAEILLNQLPNAQFVSFTKCGHWVQWERAAEFNSIVPAFLAGYSSER